jgi:putative selenate reductase molybdopterin-binding subunit
MKVIGKKTPRLDGMSLATGKPVFVDDINIPGTVYIKILRSVHAHAKIVDINLVEALKVQGVVTILTHKDFPPHYYTTAGQGYPEPSPRDTRILDSIVRYVGDEIAIIAAESTEIAEIAMEKIQVEYKLLPHNFDMEKAMVSPQIHCENDKTGIHDSKKNIASHISAEIGDVEKSFSKAKYVFEEKYSTPYVQHAHIEPHVTRTWLDENDRLVIRAATQVPFHVRRIVAEVLSLPISKVRVIKPRIGGGFGGKQEILTETFCSAITIKTGRPARIELTRDEEFYASRSRHPQNISLKIGLDQNYKIVGMTADILENCGAYGPHALTVMSVSSQKLFSIYKMDNFRLTGNAVYTNLPIAAAYRGYGAPQAFFALESLLDEVANELKICPIELRKNNLFEIDDEIPIMRALGEGREGFAAYVYSNGLKECLDLGKELIGWSENIPTDQPSYIRSGIGVAATAQGSGIAGIDMAAAFIKMNEDGSFNLLVGATDLGTGSDTALAQIAAEVLEVPVHNINVYSSDTDLTPFDTGAYASSTTYVSGGAVKKAAEKVKELILSQGRKFLNSEIVRIDNELVIADNGDTISFSDLCTQSFYTENQMQIMAEASNMSFDSPQPFNATFAKVDVDIETGIVHVKKIVSVTDAGRIINPEMSEGQVEGAIPQSLGMVFSEFMTFDEDGKTKNTNFIDYNIYTAIDMPEIIVRFVETDEPTAPFGAKAVAEIPINAPAPAVVNAIFNATGIRIRKLPIIPEKLIID